MPNTSLLSVLQDNNFLLPNKDRAVALECCIIACGEDGFEAEPSHKGELVEITFKSKMHLDAAEKVIREVFKEEISAREGFWAEWDLSQ